MGNVRLSFYGFSIVLRGLMLVAVVMTLSGCVVAAVGVGTAGVAAGTSEKGLGTSIADSGIKTKISQALFDDDFDLFSGVTISVNQGSVLLTGTVAQPEQRVRANQIAWNVRGVVEVINEIDVTDQSSFRDFAKDLASSAQLRAALIGDSAISSLNFSIDVVNGTVFLTGIAATEEEMRAVVEHARGLRFATEVVNYIQVNPDTRQ